MLGVIIYSLLMIALGLPIINRFNQGRFGVVALSGFAYLIGSSLIGLEYFLAVFLFKLTDYSCFLWLIPLQTVALWCLFNKSFKLFDFRAVNFKFKGWSVLEKILLAFVVVSVVLSLTEAWLKPVVHWDALTMWSYKAKLAYENPVGFLNPESSAYWQKTGHANYPWQISFNQVYLSQLVGRFDDAMNNFLFVGFFIALLAIFYESVKIYSNRQIAVLLMSLLVATPFIFYHSFNAYADLPLAVYAVAGLAWFAFGVKDKKSVDLWLALSFWGLAFWVKNEGALFLLAGLIVLLFKTIKEKQIKKYLPALAFSLPIIIWVGYLKLSGLGLKHTTEGGGWGFHPEVFKAFFESMFIHSGWNIFWYVVIAWLVINFKKIKESKEMLPVFGWWLVMAGIFMGIYLFSPSYLYAVDQTAFGRNLLVLTPALFLIIGLNEKYL